MSAPRGVSIATAICAGRDAGSRQDPIETGLHGFSRVDDTSFFAAPPCCVDQAHRMALAAPIDPDIPRDLVHLPSLISPTSRCASSALYWRSLGAIPHGTCTTDTPSRH